MFKDGDKWIGCFRLQLSEYYYKFSVDGHRIPDPANQEIITDGGVEYKRIFVDN
jgi:hypothetical protein